ncbi:MAG: type III polyketide synthase [Halofilum sp. (in: g-proteobacteria)]
MRVSIQGRGTAQPAHALSQEQAADIAVWASGGDARESRLIRSVFRHSGVQRRGSVLLRKPPDDGVLPAELTEFFPAAEPGHEAGPSVRERMTAFHTHAAPLALAAAGRAMTAAAVEPNEVAQVVAVSCTGLGSPGLEVALVEGLGLPASTGRTMIGFMGCHGLINGLRVARALALADPERPVLLCAVELCSLHYQYARDPRMAVADALFADGAAALLLRAGIEAHTGTELRAVGTCLLPDSAADMTWRIGNHGFEMTLSPRVPELIEAQLGPWLRDWLGEHGLTIADVGSWAIHPGGPRVLDAVCTALELPERAVAPSREVLAEAGNMSSPTVAFILDRLRQKGADGPTVLLAFGPGLVAEAALIV